jgi:hypothetical protein
MGIACLIYFTLLDRDTGTIVHVLDKQLTRFLAPLLPNANSFHWVYFYSICYLFFEV